MNDHHRHHSFAAAAIAAALLVPAGVHAEESYPGYGYGPTAGDHIGEKEYWPYLNIGYPQRVYWGDTHLHTSYSTDAGMIGNRLGPEGATGSPAARPSSPVPACALGCSGRWTSWWSPTTRRTSAWRR